MLTFTVASGFEDEAVTERTAPSTPVMVKGSSIVLSGSTSKDAEANFATKFVFINGSSIGSVPLHETRNDTVIAVRNSIDEIFLKSFIS